MIKTKWCEFKELPSKSKKTSVWIVKNKVNGCALGVIKWNGGWRAYVFEPGMDTFYGATCLNEISEFIKSEMEKRRSKCIL